MLHNVQRGQTLQFLIGGIMVFVGGYLFFNDLMIISSRYLILNQTGFALFILLIGVALVTFSARRKIGWLLILGSLVVIFLEIATNLIIAFRPTTFLETIAILGLLFGGFGIVMRSFRSR